MISAALRDDHVVCIFPEGAITRDGKLAAFRPGVDRILKTDPVPVYMLAINGLWGSFFSRMGGRAMSRLPHPSRRIISVVVQRFQDSAEKKTDAIAPVLQKEMAGLLDLASQPTSGGR